MKMEVTQGSACFHRQALMQGIVSKRRSVFHNLASRFFEDMISPSAILEIMRA